MTVAGNESRRQLCLQEMGIQAWYPRVTLPHAEARRLQARTDTPVVNPEAVPAAPQQAQSRLADTPAVAETGGPAPAAPPLVQPTATPHFAFAYLSVCDALAVVAEIPYATRGRLQAPVRALLSRILEALHVPVQSGATPVIHFQWPLHEDDHLEHGMDNARQTVQGFLTRQLRDRPVPFLLVFSERWPEYLFPAQFQEQTAGLFRHPQFPAQVLVTRGLHVMLADESIKRPVWKQLQRLKLEIGKTGAGGQ